jgi:hypothetical protein
MKPSIAISLLTTSLMSGQFVSADDKAPTLSRRDTLRIAAQQICPVSGKKLGSMGTPIKKRIGDQDLFLCCNACTKGKVDRKHWATVHANFKRAQGTCPVMGKPLPVKSKWTVVEGQLVYVCCPPCIEKIQREPAKWLAKVDEFYAAATATPDQVKIAAQQICPVSGKRLGIMGTPIKRKIGKEEVFLCCEACTKGKVDRKHWGTIHANFAKAQGMCPVMKKPLPANPKWTVVDGQIVYVCCPPCVKKIEADPKTFVTKVASLYTASLKKASPTKKTRQ